MLSRKLLALLTSFSGSERKNFRKFLRSPFFNENVMLIQLFDIIEQYLSKPKEEVEKIELSKSSVWQKLYPKKAYSDVQMRRLSSDLNLLAQQYLSHKVFKNTSLGEQHYLIQALNNPKLTKHFVGAVRQARLENEKSPLQNADTHLENHRIEYQCHIHLDQLGYKRNDFENFENADYHLDCFYISTKLKTYCEALDYRGKMSINPNIQISPGFMDQIKESNYFQEPSIKVYYLAIQMMENSKDEVHFQQLKAYVNEHIDCFPAAELKFLYTLLMNYCIDTKINNGQEEYYTELFSLYKKTLDKTLIFEKGALPPNHYKNILTIAMHIKAFDWSESFIQTYTEKLPKENQENALNYNLAKLYFHQEDYEKVIEQLREVEYQNLQYALGGKLMLLKTYYELEEVTALDSLIESFRIYLRRNTRISRDLKQQYMNVLRFTRKLSILAPYDKSGLEKVATQIENCKALAAKQWLLSKVAEKR